MARFNQLLRGIHADLRRIVSESFAHGEAHRQALFLQTPIRPMLLQRPLNHLCLGTPLREFSFIKGVSGWDGWRGRSIYFVATS